MVLSIALLFPGCSPEVGSKKWCTKMESTPKGDWTANMAADYTKYCLLKMQDE